MDSEPVQKRFFGPRRTHEIAAEIWRNIMDNLPMEALRSLQLTDRYVSRTSTNYLRDKCKRLYISIDFDLQSFCKYTPRISLTTFLKGVEEVVFLVSFAHDEAVCWPPLDEHMLPPSEQNLVLERMMAHLSILMRMLDAAGCSKNLRKIRFAVEMDGLGWKLKTIPNRNPHLGNSVQRQWISASELAANISDAERDAAVADDYGNFHYRLQWKWLAVPTVLGALCVLKWSCVKTVSIGEYLSCFHQHIQYLRSTPLQQFPGLQNLTLTLPELDQTPPGSNSAWSICLPLFSDLGVLHLTVERTRWHDNTVIAKNTYDRFPTFPCAAHWPRLKTLGVHATTDSSRPEQPAYLRTNARYYELLQFFEKHCNTLEHLRIDNIIFDCVDSALSADRDPLRGIVELVQSKLRFGNKSFSYLLDRCEHAEFCDRSFGYLQREPNLICGSCRYRRIQTFGSQTLSFERIAGYDYDALARAMGVSLEYVGGKPRWDFARTMQRR